jgi:hypothetical protein
LSKVVKLEAYQVWSVTAPVYQARPQRSRHPARLVS